MSEKNEVILDDEIEGMPVKAVLIEQDSGRASSSLPTEAQLDIEAGAASLNPINAFKSMNDALGFMETGPTEFKGYINELQPSAKTKKGSSPKDETTAYDPLSTKTTNVVISRDDDGCRWSYENDDDVYRSIMKITQLINRPILSRVNPKYTKSGQAGGSCLDALELIESRAKKVRRPIKAFIANQYCYGYAMPKKVWSAGSKSDIVRLLPLNPPECIPIRNLQTGDLGQKNIEPNNKGKEIALIQNGNVATYDSTGNVTYKQEYFYFERNDIIPLSLGDRGMFKGVSPVMRVLRYVEMKRTFMNILELVMRRFGPQIIVTIGNDKVNLFEGDAPKTYLDANPGDREAAKRAYKQAVFTAIKTKIKRWIDGDTLVSIQEYGIGIETMNPSNSLPQYNLYISMLGGMIRNAIVGLFLQGRVDITSAAMETSVFRELKDAADEAKTELMDTLQDEYFGDILEANSYKRDLIICEFEQVDYQDRSEQIKLDKMISEMARNFKMAKVPIPKEIKERYGIEDEGPAIEKMVKTPPEKDDKTDVPKKKPEVKKESEVALI